AHRNLPAKNTLAPVDAHAVEVAFGRRLGTFAEPATPTGQAGEPRIDGTSPTEPGAPASIGSRSVAHQRRAVPEKSIRLRDPEHRKFVARQRCLLCGRTPSDAHHLR